MLSKTETLKNVNIHIFNTYSIDFNNEHMSSCLTVNMQKEGGWADVKRVNSAKS